VIAFCASQAAAQDDLVERGRYLVEGPMGCGNCHSPKGPGAADDLSGILVNDNPAFTTIALDIILACRIAGWSDAELARAIHDGIRPDGWVIRPPMPFSAYRGISDADLAAVVAYLRTVPAVQSTLPSAEYRGPVPPAYGPPVESVTAPAPAATAE
jgi:mono/diheme cytochrome c family protein